MSTEAIMHVLDRFPYGGAKLVAMIAIARYSKDRRDPFTATCSGAQIAKLCRNSSRAAFQVLNELERLGYFTRTRKDGKMTAFVLQIAYPRPMKKTKGVPMKKSSQVVRENPLREPRAPFSDENPRMNEDPPPPPNIVPFQATG